MLHPGEVGVAGGRHAKFPAHILAQPVAAPIVVVEGRIRQNVVGLQILEGVVLERALFVPRDMRFDAANGHVHHGQPPCGVIGFLPINGNVADASAVGFHEFFALHEHPARPAARIKHAAFVGRENFNQQPDDMARGVKLAALLALGAGELAQKVFIHAARGCPLTGFRGRQAQSCR